MLSSVPSVSLPATAGRTDLRTVPRRPTVLPRERMVLVVAVSRQAGGPAGIPAGRRRPPSLSRRRTVLADGYISSAAIDGPSGLWVQRHHITRWADAHGWRLARVVEELMVSDLPARRAALRAALERVESGESDGVVVARLKNIGSSLVEAVDTIERIQAAGGTFVSVCDGIDLGTPSGRLILPLLVSVARW